MKRFVKKRVVFASLAAVGVAASCSSLSKDSNSRLLRGRDGDEAKVVLDLSRYVQNTTDVDPPATVPEDQRVADPDVKTRQRWQNFKVRPRNFHFSVAVAPLYVKFRHATDAHGEPPENFSDKVLERPIDDDENRPQAPLPPEDLLAGVPLLTEAQRQAAEKAAVAQPTSGSEGTAPPSSSSVGEAPSTPGTAPEAPSAEKPADAPKSTTPSTDVPPAEKAGEAPRAPDAPPAEAPKADAPKTDTPPADKPVETPAPAETPAPVKPRGHRIGRAETRIATTRYAAAEEGATATPEVASISSESASGDDDDVERVSSYEGMNFEIDPAGYQKRMAQVLNEFRVFENVDTEIRFNEQKSRDDLFEKAEAAGDDFLLLSTLKRNKVSYRGVSLGGALGDDLLWVAFWFPSEFFGFIPREQYRCDVELKVELVDVRSRYPVVNQTFKGEDLLVLTGRERGYQIFGPFTVAATNWYRHEALFSEAGAYVRPGAWVHMESQVLDHLCNRFKKDIDRTEPPTFEDLTNNQNVRSKQLALVCGITRYGEKAQPKLREWAAGSADPEKQAVVEKQLSVDYDNQPIELGTRPYAENDAKRMSELLHRRGALEAPDGVTQANLFELFGKDATIDKLRSAFRQLARSRREDKVIVYLNGETVVVDTPDHADETAKYFLPYDVDLTEVEKRQDDPTALREYLDRYALSFDWIDDCLNKSGAEDHVYLQSRHAFVIADCSFPGVFTRDRFCPKRAAKTHHVFVDVTGHVSALQGVGQITSETGGKTPGAQPPKEAPPAETPKAQESPKAEAPAETPKPQETPRAEAPAETPKPAESPKAEAPAETPKPQESPKAEDSPAPKPATPRGHRIGFAPERRVPAGTLVAGDPAAVDSSAPAQASSEFLTTGFLERLVQGGQGRTIVLTSALDELPLDLPGVKEGGFVYYFTQFLDRADRVQPRADGAYLGLSLVDYARDRIEAESRQVGRPQHVIVLGDRGDFVILKGAR